MEAAAMAARGRLVREGTPGTRAEQERADLERAEKEKRHRRWDHTHGREERVQDEDGIDLRMEAPSNDNWLDSLANRTQSNQTPDGQPLLTRLDMCEESKNKQREKLAADTVQSPTDDLNVSIPGVELFNPHTGLGDEENPGDGMGEDDADGASSVGAASAGSLTRISGDGVAFAKQPAWDAVSACGGRGNAASIGMSGSSEVDVFGERRESFMVRMCARIPVFDPVGGFRTAWDWFVIALVVYVAVMVPVTACILSSLQKWPACMTIEGPDGTEETVYGTWEDLYAAPAWGKLDLFGSFVDSIFIIDVFLNFNTGFMDKHGDKIWERPLIAKNYIQGFFFIDVISSIPFDAFIKGENVGAMSALKCIRLLRLGRLMKKLDAMQNANVFRVVKLMLSFTLITHWVATLWFMIGATGAEEPWSDSQPEQVSWIFEIRSNFPECHPKQFSFSYWYMISFYWAITTLTTVGYGDITPITSSETWFTICVEWSGNVISAVIVGNVAVLLGTFEAAYQRYRERIETLNAFTEMHEIPGLLAKRMMMSIDFFFEKTQGLDFTSMLHKVSPAMRAEVLLVLYGSSISSTNLFEDAPEAVVKAIVQKIECVEYFTDDFVVRAGDPGTHLYIVHVGKVQIVPKSEARAKKSRAVMAGGALFGEMPVFSGKPHLTHIKCVEPCELLQLSKYDLEDLLVDFPEFMTLFKERVKSKMRYLRHMRTAGQAPPEMLELHGLEAPEFVRPKHGGESDGYDDYDEDDEDDDDTDSKNSGAPSKDSMDQSLSSPTIGTDMNYPSENMYNQTQEQAGSSALQTLGSLGEDVGEPESPSSLLGNTSTNASLGSRRPSLNARPRQ